MLPTITNRVYKWLLLFLGSVRKDVQPLTWIYSGIDFFSQEGQPIVVNKRQLLRRTRLLKYYEGSHFIPNIP
ncbi:hypothetical protein YC2023_016541 [Brassica napus]